MTAAGRLSGHPHVTDVYDAGTLGDGRPYLVMELCPAGPLNDLLRGHGPMTAAQVRDIGIKIADALAAAHLAGVLRRTAPARPAAPAGPQPPATPPPATQPPRRRAARPRGSSAWPPSSS